MDSFLRSIAVFALVALTSRFVGAEECSTIVDVACDNSDFSVLCDLITASPTTIQVLSSGNWTVFAPTDDAFAALDADFADSLLNCSDALNGVLAFHVIDDIVFSKDLSCKETVMMANGDESRTVCNDGSQYQKGSSNSRDAMPEIIATDIDACGSIVHVVNQVMLPKEKYIGLDKCEETVESDVASSPVRSISLEKISNETECLTIPEVACSNSDFSILCQLISEFDLDSVLYNDTWTVFAPTDEAFNTLDEVLDIEPTYEQVFELLAFHAHAGEMLLYDDLTCKELLPMSNGDDSRTKCITDDDVGIEYKYQKGAGQYDGLLPKIIEADISACNGIIHVVDNVLVPKL